MSLPPNAACPCHSGRKYKKCCRLPHEGQAAASAEALMRSRYSAYALDLTSHILRTTHPAGPHWQPDAVAWAEEVHAFCAQTSFVGLEILEARAVGDKGIVLFRAHLSGPSGTTTMVERSLFERVDGRWLYHSGVHETG